MYDVIWYFLFNGSSSLFCFVIKSVFNIKNGDFFGFIKCILDLDCCSCIISINYSYFFVGDIYISIL